MITIWEDNFESGDAISVAYVNNYGVETNSSCGRDGSWGVHGHKYSSYFTKPLDVSYRTRAYYRVDVDFNSSDSASAECITLRDSYDPISGYNFINLGRKLNDPNDVFIALWSEDPSEFAWSVDGVWAVGVWAQFRLEVWFSTGGGMGVPANPDGRIRASINGIAVIDSTGLRVQTRDRFLNGVANEIKYVHIDPGGDADNFGIYTDDLVTPSVSPSISASKSSSTSPSVSPSASPSEGTPVGMRLRLWNETAGASVGESALINSTVPVDASFAVTLTPGVNSYKLQVTADEPNVDLFVSGAVIAP